MTVKIKLPEGEAEFGSEDEALWTKVLDARKHTIKDLEDSLKVEREIKKLAERKLEELK
jgi:hypothetical protein